MLILLLAKGGLKKVGRTLAKSRSRHTKKEASLMETVFLQINALGQSKIGVVGKGEEGILEHRETGERFPRRIKRQRSGIPVRSPLVQTNSSAHVGGWGGSLFLFNAKKKDGRKLNPARRRGQCGHQFSNKIRRRSTSVGGKKGKRELAVE